MVSGTVSGTVSGMVSVTVACNDGRNDGHFTVTLACSLLAEAAQATTPPIPLLVAAAQGLGPTLGPLQHSSFLLLFCC